MAKRVQRKRTKGWKMPDNCVYVGRPTLWGNPFIHKDMSVAVEAYRELISSGTKSFAMGPGRLQFAGNAHPDTLHHAYPEFVKGFVRNLRGKDLACWCALNQPCHADILLELAEKTGEPHE